MVSTILFCVGCRPAEPDAGRLALDPAARWSGDRLLIDTGIDFLPSPAVREALEHGVDLQLDVEIRLARRHGPIAREIDRRATPLRIRYLPLTEQWQLEEKGGTRIFPRFWLLREALAETRSFDTGITRPQADERPLQLQVRARINRDVLPAPMHLPTLFSSQWHLGEQWHAWHFGPS